MSHGRGAVPATNASDPLERRRDAASSRWARRHPWLTGVMTLVVALTPIWWSLGNALTNRSLGNTLAGRAAEWARDHGARPLVVWAENTWYSRHPPPVGGKPPPGAIPSAVAGSNSAAATGRAPSPSARPRPNAASIPAHLPAPAPLQPFVSDPLPGEGQWQPAGRRIGGVPAAYEAFLRPDAVHTSLVAGVAWMDTELLRARLYSGSYIPGGGPWQFTAPVSATDATSLVAAFNSGFRMKDAEGGYYSEGRTVFPLRSGAASLVIYSDGTATVGQWGRDVTMTPRVVAVRQNLRLLVDNGAPVPGLNANDTHVWGNTVSNRVYVWRSGLGVTSSGALVYVAGPGLNITSLANLLVRAGAVRAMELDINTDWVNLATWSPGSPDGSATAGNGKDLLDSMVGKPDRYFTPSWSRDFVTMSVRAMP